MHPSRSVRQFSWRLHCGILANWPLKDLLWMPFPNSGTRTHRQSRRRASATAGPWTFRRAPEESCLMLDGSHLGAASSDFRQSSRSTFTEDSRTTTDTHREPRLSAPSPCQLPFPEWEFANRPSKTSLSAKIAINAQMAQYPLGGRLMLRCAAGTTGQVISLE